MSCFIPRHDVPLASSSPAAAATEQRCLAGLHPAVEVMRGAVLCPRRKNTGVTSAGGAWPCDADGGAVGSWCGPRGRGTIPSKDSHGRCNVVVAHVCCGTREHNSCLSNAVEVQSICFTVGRFFCA